jgi:CBS domain containing-hemolysin-like protein
VILLLIVPLFLLIVLFTAIQTLYLEGMRLRSRDVSSLDYFKSEVEPHLKLRPEEGNLTFSLWKHSCLVVFGVAILADVVDGGMVTPGLLIEGMVVAWLLVILSAYLIPQLLFRRTSGHWLAAILPFYTISALVIRPLVLALNFLHSLLDITSEDPARDEPATPAENVDTLITVGAEEGLIQEEDRKLIQSVVAFGEKVVREVMTPRPNIVAIAADETLEALRDLVINEQYSRIPVFETSVDDIIGFVHVRDMFECDESERLTRKVRELMRPIRFVPETKPVDDLMREMQQEGAHLAVVVDEYGNTAGLVSMEDLVEVILGEIRDEHEPGTDVTQDGDGLIVSGSFDVARIAEVLSFEPGEFQPGEDGDAAESTTVGGLAMEWLGRVPKPGESVERGGLRIEVLASDDMRVEKVRLSRSQPVEKSDAN